MEIEKRLLVNPPFSNKKGLSAVVTTLLIILLAIVLIGVVWVVVSNLISTGSEDVNLEQFTLDLSIRSAYVDDTVGGDIKVGVRRSAGSGELAGIRFVFFDGTESISIDRMVSLGPTDIKVFAFDNSTEVAGINAGDEVSVVPLFETDTGRQKAANIADSREISGEIPEGGAGVGSYDDETTDGGNNDNEETTNGGGEEEDSLPDPGESCEVDEDCESGLKCDSETNECVLLCNGTWEQGYYNETVYECDGEEVNGCNLNTCLCETGFSPAGDGGTCALDNPINEGDIFSVWPEENQVHRFQSADLPKDQLELLDYTSYYVNFSQSGSDLSHPSETRCFRIQSATYFSDIDMSEIGLLINTQTEDLANVTVAQYYRIWEAENCGQ